MIETRKTVPGLRVLDKWGVLAGGGANHRIGLFDMVMIKDNHVTAAGGITAALQRTRVSTWLLLLAFLATVGGSSCCACTSDSKIRALHPTGACMQEYLATRSLKVPIEVETRTLEEVDEVLGLLSGPNPPRIDRLMLDNMAHPGAGVPVLHGDCPAASCWRWRLCYRTCSSCSSSRLCAQPCLSITASRLQQTVQTAQETADEGTKLPADGALDTSMLQEAVRRVGGAVETEASGNVTLGTVRQIAQTGVTYISSGALTHSVTALDISLKIVLS